MTAAKKIRVLSRQLNTGLRHTAYYLAPDGTYRGVGTYSDKAVARLKALEGYRAAREPAWIDPRGSKTVLDTYATETWFPSILVEIKTRAAYESYYRNHVKPAFGSREMGTIVFSEVQGWLNDMEARGIGRSAQRHSFIILNMILKSAQRDRLISSRPTEGVQTRPIPVPEVKIFQPQHWQRFYEQVPEHWQPLMLVAVETGMRASEIRALCPAQVDWTRQRIRIDRATVTISDKSGYGRFVDKAYPKGKRSRSIRVDAEVLMTLAQLMVRRGLAEDSTERFFLSGFGRPIAEEVNDVMAAACTAAGVPARSFKHLRATKASWMLKETRDLMGVKEHLGHAHIATTQKYLALVEDEDEETTVRSFRDYLPVPAV